MASEISREMPVLHHNKSALFQELPMIAEEEVTLETENSCGWVGNMVLMGELRKKILIFRDFIDLPPCDTSGPINNLMMRTVEDLQNIYPKVIPRDRTLGQAESSTREGLIHLYNALRFLEGSWAKHNNWISYFDDSAEDNLENVSLDQLGGRVLTKLHHMIKIAREMFDLMDEDDESQEKGMEGAIFGDILSQSYSGNKTSCPSPDTPTAFSPEFTGDTVFQPFLLPHRIQAVRQWKLLDSDMRCFSFNRLLQKQKQGDSFRKDINTEERLKTEVQEVAEEIQKNPADSNAPNGNSDVKCQARSIGDEKPPPPPPPPPPLPPLRPNYPSLPHDQHSQAPQAPHPPTPPPTPAYKGTKPMPPPPAPLSNAMAQPRPPPPGGMAKALRAKKSNNKLKRSTLMGKLYHVLKRKLEGKNSRGNQSQGKKAQLGASSGGKQGMADAIAEMTKRSTYFQQIEEDVKNHGSLIEELRAAITAFETRDMAELVKFHRYVEQDLEKLTDETQVLARFEGFPTKKLEALRMAAALYSRLEGIYTELENWKVEPPLKQLLDKVEAYFNKIKEDIDALERSKDEETKRLQSQDIHFDFGILVRIKESMVDVSSSCMELALQERREINAAADAENGVKASAKVKACTKMLWRAFQLAFRVYNFAGGQDDRADQLSRELAQEIEADPQKE